jgi:2-dehydro-3-deoxyphosphooctonate aldolase (KDO 8-P synthase)
MAPREVAHAVEKAHTFGAESVMVTERGTTFGYHDLVVDFRGFAEVRRHAPLCFDATHAVQRPGAGERASSGDRRCVAPLARAAVVVGVDALFVEVHPEPDRAPCDGLCQLRIEDMERLLTQVQAIAAVVSPSGDAKS